MSHNSIRKALREDYNLNIKLIHVVMACRWSTMERDSWGNYKAAAWEGKHFNKQAKK